MINLADIVAASNGLYDNVVAVSNVQPVVGVVMLVSMGVAIGTAWVGSSVRRPTSVANLICVITFALSVTTAICSFALVVGQSVVLRSRPFVMDVVEACYGVELLQTDDTSDFTVHCFADYDAVSDTASAATFDSDGKVLNAVVVVDDSLNVYVINADTNTVVEPEVSNSSKIVILLEEKFQS